MFQVQVLYKSVDHNHTNIPTNFHLHNISWIEHYMIIVCSSQIVESGASIVTGRIYAKKNVGQDYRVLPSPAEVTGPNIKHLLTKDFYKELRLRGYQYR